MSMDLIDIAMAAAMKKGGGSGGTSDYTDLSNKPEINGRQLIGNKTAADLGLQTAIDTTHKLDADLVDDSTSGHKFAWSGTQAAYAQAAANIAMGELVAFTDDTDIDTVPTEGSSNPVTSDGIKTALDGKQDEITSANKLSADLVDDASATNKFVSAAEKTSIGNSATKLTGVDSSATNYIELTNGKRLYLSGTEPTGTIPDGAFWIGGTVT